jgi:hypothetical protein
VIEVLEAEADAEARGVLVEERSCRLDVFVCRGAEDMLHRITRFLKRHKQETGSLPSPVGKSLAARLGGE